MTPGPPPFWNPLAKYRAWAQENPAQAQIAWITAFFIGSLILLAIITIIMVVALLRG